MIIKKQKLGINLLFYLLSITVIFIIIRIIMERLNISFTIQEGLVSSQDIQEISKTRKFKMRKKHDSGKKTADNLINPVKKILMEHLDHIDKYKNKNNSKDMKLITDLKVSAYDKIKKTIQKSYEGIKKHCSLENELFKKRDGEIQKMMNSSPFKEKQAALIQKWREWAGPMEEKYKIVRNDKEKEQVGELFSYMFNIGLSDKINKDICNMLIEDPDTEKGNVSAKQKMKTFLERSIVKGGKIINKMKKHAYFKNVEKDYKTHLEQEKQKKK